MKPAPSLQRPRFTSTRSEEGARDHLPLTTRPPATCRCGSTDRTVCPHMHTALLRMVVHSALGMVVFPTSPTRSCDSPKNWGAVSAGERLLERVVRCFLLF